MNGVHDMGGMHGMGPIQQEKNEPVFHARWEARVFALNRAVGAWGKWNIDASRHAKELIPAAEYLRISYYEKFLVGMTELLIKSGLVTRAEVESGKPVRGSKKASPPLTADKVPLLVSTGVPASRSTPAAAKFRVGQRIRARNINPTGSYAIASLCACKARYDRARSWSVRLPRHQRPLPRGEPAACLLGALRRARVMGRASQSAGCR